ncbi:hypothetical protein [Caenimonas koreensis]|uniref:Uncharacterized protein n=1 Tax=Caenimonas koreensis DSM 17982 TaxID=1121255 RepID=A0A844AP05_9BURK|nr:hypothetical protein [Caenimonas koreensis]MRD45695.1 hypothetical protein [Caenimonas koreensis DSM 17982]
MESLCVAGMKAIRKANAAILRKLWAQSGRQPGEPLMLSINGCNARMLNLVDDRYLTVHVSQRHALLCGAAPHQTEDHPDGVYYTFDLHEFVKNLSVAGMPIL